MAKASLVLSICGFTFAVFILLRGFGFFDYVPVVGHINQMQLFSLTFIFCAVGLVLGIISRTRPGVKRKIALAGIILNSAALAVAIYYLVFMMILFATY